MRSGAPSRLHVTAVLIAMLAALLLRAWLQVTLRDYGYEPALAGSLSYLVVPPVLLILLFPVLRQDREFIQEQFSRSGITWKVVLAAIAIGLFFRLAWWSQIVARTALGLSEQSMTTPGIAPVVQHQCSSVQAILIGIFVSALLIPVIEELVHRGYTQSLLKRRGPLIAIGISTLVFMLFHRYSGWPIAAAGGVLLGTMYWISGSLWAPVITHAVINLVPHVTWACLTVSWNPDRGFLPMWKTGLTASVTFLLSVAVILWLVMAGLGHQGRRAPVP